MTVIILRGRFDAKLALASVIPMLLFQNRTRRHQDSLETASRRPRNAPMHFKGLSRPSQVSKRPKTSQDLPQTSSRRFKTLGRSLLVYLFFNPSALLSSLASPLPSFCTQVFAPKLPQDTKRQASELGGGGVPPARGVSIKLRVMYDFGILKRFRRTH